MSYHKQYIDNCQYEKRGVLSLLGDGGYPYGFPLSHLYSEEDNCSGLHFNHHFVCDNLTLYSKTIEKMI